MDFLRQLIQNEMLMTPIIAWVVAQITKTIIHGIMNKEFKAERMVGAGGMPSCHSATVTALATSACLVKGPGSAEFGITVIFAIVTMYDAMGVRRETGRQGEVLNDMIELFKKMGQKLNYDKALKELIGHTPFQVLIGMLFGIGISFLVHYFVF